MPGLSIRKLPSVYTFFFYFSSNILQSSTKSCGISSWVSCCFSSWVSCVFHGVFHLVLSLLDDKTDVFTFKKITTQTKTTAQMDFQAGHHSDSSNSHKSEGVEKDKPGRLTVRDKEDYISLCWNCSKTKTEV